jgi:SAM-dependent MidA family methyltransferase
VTAAAVSCTETTPLAQRLAERIAADGPMRLDHWMAACNAHYYASRDPFGAAGDFTTAPEISQMFGELVGGWIADLALRAGAPAIRIVELGPGRGTLMADALRVLRRVPGLADRVAIALVETSARLRAMQRTAFAGADCAWFDRFEAIPADRPMIIVANEFFDALPIRRGLEGGRERAVALTDAGFGAASISADLEPGEFCAAGQALAAAIGGRIAACGGAALIIDYGHSGMQAADTLQALRHHTSADPFADPGECDLTAHVDFAAIAAAARTAAPVAVFGPERQGVWLGRLGIEPRAAALKVGATPRTAAGIEAALVRLTAPAQMGSLFKVIALVAPGWPQPAGFAPGVTA